MEVFQLPVFHLVLLENYAAFNKVLTFCQKCIQLFEDLEVTVENQRKKEEMEDRR